MPTKVQETKINKLRYAEYYGQQDTLDDLFDKSRNGYEFNDLMQYITSDENILMAYRSIKRNAGSMTAGTDNLTIKDIEKYDVDELCNEVRRRLNNYRPKSVKRVEIPKPNGDTRPLGIPCIWDRLIQQCILQILEPICEAKFSDNSYGFRPLRSTENAIAAEMRLINQSKLHYVVEIDIKGFFDNVNHSKLIKQIWTLGIRDKKLISIIKAILKATIKLPDGTIIIPDKGTPQGGILSPLLANIVLNELDQWVDSQWIENPVVYNYKLGTNPNGSIKKNSAYIGMRKTNLKEMFIIRYADDIRILCRTEEQAKNTMAAIIQWLETRLHLNVSIEKTRVVNLEKHYSEFLGFKLKVERKSNQFVVISHISDKAKNRIISNLKQQIKIIQHPKNNSELFAEICKYNAMVRGIHNYYEIATEVSIDFRTIAWQINHVWQRFGKALKKEGNVSNKSQDYMRYGKSQQLRYLSDMWILPIGYIQHKNPMCKKRNVCIYTKNGRDEIHKQLMFDNAYILNNLSKNPITSRSVEYNDNRLSLFSAQLGKCAITGVTFNTIDEIHCHHKIPLSMGGDDNYKNLILILPEIHILIHATQTATINKYLSIIMINDKQMIRLNELRVLVGNQPINN